MGQYKVPQNVEAEDKIIGPLTLKQFLYAIIGILYGLISFQLLKGVIFIWLIVGLPPSIVLLLLGLYQTPDQSFEARFLAFVSFMTKSKQRVWSKEPIAEAFKVETPIPKAEEVGRDPREVMGQLEKLAQIVDSRGGASKQPEIQEPTANSVNLGDRIAAPGLSAQPGSVTEPEVSIKDDILDLSHNPSAQNLGALIEDTAKSIKADALEKMRNPKTETRGLKPDLVASANPQASVVGPQSSVKPTISGMTTNPLAGILKLAMESDDLTVSQIAAQANKQAPLAEGQTVNLRDEHQTK